MAASSVNGDMQVRDGRPVPPNDDAAVLSRVVERAWIYADNGSRTDPGEVLDEIRAILGERQATHDPTADAAQLIAYADHATKAKALDKNVTDPEGRKRLDPELFGSAELLEADMILGLDALLRVQVAMYRAVHGKDHIEVSKEDTSSYSLALIAEVAELASAMGFKPWKNGRESDDRVLDELADVLAFVGTMLSRVIVLTGADVEDVVRAYLNKVELNHRRAQGRVEGYQK